MKPWIVVIMLAVLGCGLYLMYATREAAPPPAVLIGSSARSPSATTGSAPIAITRSARPTPAILVDDDRANPVGTQGAEDPAGPGSAVTVEEVRDHIEASFVAAPRVASKDVAPSLESGLRAVLPVGSSVRSIECRGSLCRVETMHRGLAEVREFARRAFQELPRVSNGPAFLSPLDEPAPGMPVVAVAYIGCEGTALPIRGPLVVR